MQAGWVLSYFVLGCAGIGLAVFPEARRQVLLRGWRLVGAVVGMSRRMARWLAAMNPAGWSLPPSAVSAVPAASSLGPTHARWIWRWRWMGWSGLLLIAPLLIVLGWSQLGPRHLDGFDDRVDPANRQVAQLLWGEHLVPPPPLPPDVFTTAEVELARPLLSMADRRWERMDAAFVQRLLTVFKIMKERHGYEMALLEGYRSPERQDMLAGRGGHVTMAGAWQSHHQYGLAADCAFLRDGKLVITEKDPWAMRGYQLYGQVAEELGLSWGGRWRMMDFGHVEWRRPGARRAGGKAP